MQLEDLRDGQRLDGVVPGDVVSVVAVQPQGADVVKLIYETGDGAIVPRIFTRAEVGKLSLAHESGRPFDTPAPVAVPARRRPGRRQGDHGRPLHQGAGAARGCAWLPGRRAGRGVGSAAGRAVHRVRSASTLEGFDDAKVRTVSENASTLKFTESGFEES